jgi:hypothetical protein
MKTPAIFATVIQTADGKSRARLLIESLRAFGGSLQDCPFWLFATDPDIPCHDLADESVQVFPLNIPASVSGYVFAEKVAACARAEELAAQQGETGALVSIDAECLIVNPPSLFALNSGMDAAVRPVHVRNVGLRATDPLDVYWQKIYESVGQPEVRFVVESFVDRQHLRAYFNSHAFSVNPRLGLMRRWLALFEQLVSDRPFQQAACADPFHQIFLFQALWSALLAASLSPERIRLLPPTYNYPYNLHAQVPAARRARALNDLVCLTYEGRSTNPDEIKDIDVTEPLRSWLQGR